MEKEGRKEGAAGKIEGIMEQRGKRKGETNIAAVVDFLLANARLVLGVGGAAVLGIATLAVKRLIDRAGRPPDDEKPDKSIPEGWEELGLVSASPQLLRKGLEGVVIKQLTAASKAQKGPKPSTVSEKLKPEIKRVQLCVTLQEKLVQYYQNHVALSEDDVSRVKQQALEICTELQGFLRAKQPDMPLGEMHLGGSLLDGLQVVAANHACLLVPLQIEDKFWTLIPGEETILSNPQFWMVRRTNLEYFPRGRSFWDKFIIGGYLSSKVLVNTLNKTVMESMNWPALDGMLECTVRPVMGSQELKLEVHSEHGQLFINILPTIIVNDVILTAQLEVTGNFDNLWYQSFYTSETNKLADLDDADCGVRKRCLKTLKAVCRDCPALRKLTGRHLANVILHLSEKESDWTEAAFADRFQQVISELIGYLEQGCLPGYFNKVVNLLSDCSEEEIDDIGFTLYCAVSEPEILLQT
ncbi:mitochondrial dynamics protein MID49 isoform X2 [Amia ocellicauda]|uniref:mitochondrial dynamics protein MID49 isoform X2 n=1 Tax=Amia ocellicauda TaxID=2972642 RepID=UPI003464D247